jgi:predicted DNA repair protein MutK
LPAALLLSAFLPQAIQPLLMLGGLYLCFEGAEKVAHMLAPHSELDVEEDFAVGNPGHLEEEKVAGAIKTDFVLSAEIMTIALGAIPDGAFWVEAATLAVVGIGITVLVYGAVAVIVKIDDLGLMMAARGRLAATRGLGRGLVVGMPSLLSFLSLLGTAAMLWVGGSMLIHGAAVLGWHAPEVFVEGIAHALTHSLTVAQGFAVWLVEALAGLVLGLAIGMALIPVAKHLILPILARLTVKPKAAH